MRRLVLLVMLSILLVSCSSLSSGERRVEVVPSVGVGLGLLDVSVSADGTLAVTASAPFPQVPTPLGNIGPHADVSVQFPNKKTLTIVTGDEKWVYDLHGREFHVDLKHIDATINSDGKGNLIVFIQDATVSSREPILHAVDTEGEIEDLLKRWDAIHHQADRYWDTSKLDTVLREEALQQQRSTVASLKNQNCYWTVREIATPRITRFDVVRSDLVVYEVSKNWDMDLYCNGARSGDEDGSFTMRYNIERIDGQWYITQKQVISTY